MLLALHSSPNPAGNLERMVTHVASASGMEFELIRLTDLDMSPCLGCVRCARNNKCAQKDDLTSVFEKLVSARGLILGGVNYNGVFNSIAHIFLERLFALYHQDSILRNMPAAVVAVGGEEPEKAGLGLTSYLRDIYFFHVIGMALFKSDVPPCFSCGFGTKCSAGMPALNWPDEEFKNLTSITKNMFLRYEDNPDAVEACERLGLALGRAVSGAQAKHPRSGAGYYIP